MVVADIEKEEQKRQEFRNILFELAESQIELQDGAKRSEIYQRLEKLYHAPKKEDEFRHFYSDIFLVLTQIQQGDKPGSVDTLGQNLFQIRKGYKQCNEDIEGKPIDISDNIKKLYDHVSLDIARIGYSEAVGRRVEQTEYVGVLRTEVEKVKGNLEKVNKNVQDSIKEVDATVRNLQKESIAILGIFASIVLAFTTGIIFASSVLENIHKVSIYRIVFVSLVVGGVLVNLLYGLFYYIDRIVHDVKGRRIKPLIVTNIVIGLLMMITVAAWFFGTVEMRNQRINNRGTVPALSLEADVPQPTVELRRQPED